MLAGTLDVRVRRDANEQTVLAEVRFLMECCSGGNRLPGSQTSFKATVQVTHSCGLSESFVLEKTSKYSFIHFSNIIIES